VTKPFFSGELSICIVMVFVLDIPPSSAKFALSSMASDICSGLDNNNDELTDVNSVHNTLKHVKVVLVLGAIVTSE
jgi:hypothetical protein